MSTLLTCSNFLFPLVTFAYVARILGASGTGKVAFANSIMSYFSYIAALGVPAYGLRECAKVRDDKKRLSHLVQELLAIEFLATLLAYVLLFLFIGFAPIARGYQGIFLVLSLQLILTTIGCEWLYQALEEYSYITARSLIFKTISVVLTFLLIKSSEDVIWYAFITIFTTSASYLCNFIGLRKKVSFKRIAELNLVQHIVPIVTMLASSLIITIYANFDSTMLGIISTDATVGQYNAALKIESLVLSLSTAVTTVFIPRISHSVGQKEFNEVKRLTTTSLRVALLLTLPMIVYLSINAARVIEFLCGPGFDGAVPALHILLVCVIPLSLTNLFGNQLLMPLGLEKRYAFSVFVGLFINLTLNLALIPFFGSVGAAIGTFFTESWNALWMGLGVTVYVSYMFRAIKWSVYLIPLSFASIVTVALNCFISGLSSFGVLVVDALAFFIAFYVLASMLGEPLIRMQVKTLRSQLVAFRS